jgi:zinc protease
MAFRGSRHVPEAEVWPGFQRLGMAAGADVNAFTSTGRTVYQFNFPHNDEATIATGLLRLREVASELTLAQDAMDAERGVVLSEERLGATPEQRANVQGGQLLYPGTARRPRSPIGSVDVIKTAPVARLRDYYEAFYRPERATLVVVGEIDPAALQARIEKLFADWTPSGPPGSDPKLSMPGHRAPQATLYVEPGVAPALTLSWILPPEPTSKARMAEDYARLLALRIVERRLGPVTFRGEHPYTQFNAGLSHGSGSIRLTLRSAIRPEDWRIALTDAIVTLRHIAVEGVSVDELDSAKRLARSGIEAAVAGAATRPTRTLAAALAMDAASDEVFVSPMDRLAITDEAFRLITPERIKSTVASLMRDYGPLVVVDSPTPVDGGAAAVSAQLAASESETLIAPAVATAAQTLIWPYATFGQAGTVTERRTVADLDTTFIRFANGVRLTVRPTTFRAGEVVVNVRIGNGRLDLPSDRATPIWAIADGALASSGTAALDLGDAKLALAGKVFGTDAALVDSGLFLRGRTRPADIATQLQVFAAMVSAPGWRRDGFERARSLEMTKARRSTVSPTALMGRSIPCLLSGNDPRWCPPSLADLAKVEPDAFKQTFAPLLASAPLEVIVVGDITVDTALEAVANTFGALPQRAQPTSDIVKGMPVHFPATGGAPVVLYHTGRADQGVAVSAWPTTGAFDRQADAPLMMLQSILRTRMMEELRIRDGVTYSPGAVLYSPTISPGHLIAYVELPPARMPQFFATIRSIAADLRAHGPTADELERASAPLIDGFLTTMQTNEFWAQALAAAQEDPRRLDLVRTRIPDLRAVTPDAVRAVANRFLTDDKMWTAEVTPQAATNVAQ